MTLYLGNNLISGVATPTEPTRNLGQIIESIVPLTDAGLHLLDGALINGSGIYSAFVDAIADLVTDYPDLFETEANWQSAVTAYGVCGKFVYTAAAGDNPATVRLPKITGILEGTTDVTALGDLVEAGLPNINGDIVARGNSSNEVFASASGAMSVGGTSASWGIGTSNGISGTAYGTVTFNASSSNPIYGNSNTVHPQTIKCYYYIVIATSTKTEIEVDIDEIATDVNGKADVDLSNMSAGQSAKNEIVSWGIPDYSAGVSLSNNTQYIAPYNCYVIAITRCTANQSYYTTNFTIDDVSVTDTLYMYAYSGSEGVGREIGFFIAKGSTFTLNTTGTITTYARYPLKGVS